MTERKLDVSEREQAIFRYLRDQDDPGTGTTVPALHKHLTDQGTRMPGGEVVRDTVTMPVYYKLARRLVSTGHLLEVGDGTERFALAPHLHADTAVTLDTLWDLSNTPPSHALAALIDAREYVRTRRDETIRDAALALQKVDPRALITDMLLHKINCYNADLEAFAETGDDERHRRRLREERAEIVHWCHRYLGLARDTVTIPPIGDQLGRVVVHHAKLADAMAIRAHGDTVIDLISPETDEHNPPNWDAVAVSGSDGSTYSSAMNIDSAAAFSDDSGSEVVTFNNSMVYVRLAGELARRHPSPWYSVPLTRSAIDSPRNAGMVMAPFMYRNEGLKESEYEHLTKCATDVVQWRADEQVFRGHARSLDDATILPPPRVHLRDGTVTLQEREINHYQRNDSYGEMVREGVRIAHDVLRHLTDKRQPPVFAGAVKSSQLHVFGGIINWFIANGLPSAGVDPIDRRWDVSRASLLADNEAMTLVLSTLEPYRPANSYFTTFVLVRPFHALTDLQNRCESDTGECWLPMLQRRKDNAGSDPANDNYWGVVDSVGDDPYLRMLETADYGLFYIGHTMADPAPILPRYEFMDSMRNAPGDPTARALRNRSLIVGALHRTKWTQDRDHNFMSRKTLVRFVPFVIYEAHEKCKALGRSLESELRSMVVANLARHRGSRRDFDVRFRPLPVHAYIERWKRVTNSDRKALEEGATETPATSELERPTDEQEAT